MNKNKIFELEEARQLMPILRAMLTEAHTELDGQLELVRAANERYEAAEAAVERETDTRDLERFRAVRQIFQQAIDELSKIQTTYIRTLNSWVEKITAHGVIIRDLRAGLLDFPAERDGFSYLLCWKKDEADINFWHLENDGFIGRKPLSALREYF